MGLTLNKPNLTKLSEMIKFVIIKLSRRVIRVTNHSGNAYEVQIKYKVRLEH